MTCRSLVILLLAVPPLLLLSLAHLLLGQLRLALLWLGPPQLALPPPVPQPLGILPRGSALLAPLAQLHPLPQGPPLLGPLVWLSLGPQLLVSRQLVCLSP